MGADPAVEEQFGPYAVYERLGVGGMATVHRALERGPDGFERMVALKRLLPHLAEDASFIKSFVREAKLASILNHINIVQIYELGRVGSEYFISMEYIDGRDVRRILRHARKVTGPPPIHVTVALLIQLCEALDYAHAKVDDDGTPLKLVHRDVSPSNVIVTSSGHLKVIDFGIAKAESSQLRTQTGRVKGKLAYMAPEAIAGGRDLDARSDLWAVGVILHELLTARPLFASKNEYQTLLKVQKGELMPPSTFNQACPPELDAIVFKALARNPDDRFATAGEMREELLEIKKQYSLQTGYRDVAAWLDWAFSLEQPGSFNNQPTTGVSEVDPVSHQIRAKTPRPARNADEEEAVAMVWGNEGEQAGAESGPLLLDDVPDVSMQPTRLPTEVDDIPDAMPSHGQHGGDALLTLAAQGDDPPPPVMPDPSLARGTDLPVARGSAQMRSTPGAAGSQPKARPTEPQRAQRQTGSVSVPKPAGRTTGSMQVPRSPTGQVPVPRTPTGPVSVPRTMTGQPPRTPTGQVPVPRTMTGQRADAAQPVQRTTAQGIPAQPRTPAQGVPTQRQSDRVPAQRQSDRLPAQRQSDRVPAQRTTGASTAIEIPVYDDQAARTNERMPRAHSVAPTDPDGHPLELVDAASQSLRAEDLFGDDPDGANLAAADNAATVTKLPKQRKETEFDVTTNPTAMPIEPELPAVPVVRFSKSVTVPPVNERMTPTSMPAVSPSGLPLATTSAMPTRQGIGAVSARASTTPPLTQSQQLRTKSPSQAIGPAVVVKSNKRLWIAIAIGVVAAGAAGTAMLLFTSNKPGAAGAHVTAPTVTAPVEPTITTGTVKFVLEPADAEIKIEGMPPHIGGPWSIDLSAGIHQVEIHRQGYKAWLTSLELTARETQTLRVVLQPLGAETQIAEASLAISTTPPGLDALLDGQPLVEKTPTKTTVKVGPHTISVKQNGVEVWHQQFTAEASSDYEFNPSFTAEKKALRAATPATPPRPRPAPAAAPKPDETKAEAPKTEPPKADEPKPAEPAAAQPTAAQPAAAEPKADKKPAGSNAAKPDTGLEVP